MYGKTVESAKEKNRELMGWGAGRQTYLERSASLPEEGTSCVET